MNMKTAKMIFAAFVIAAPMTSCTKEPESNNNEITSKTLEFTAAWAEEDASRTVLQEDGTSIWWNTNEEINVFIGEDVSSKFVSTNTKPQAIASFVGNALIGYSESSGDFPGYWAVYPYNKDNSCNGSTVSLKVKSRQAAAAGTFADKCFPAVAQSTNFSLAFYNVCGGARFSVTREGVKRVVFRSNDESPMAGKVRVGFGEDDKPQILEVTEPVDSVVLNAKDGSLIPGANYFASMIPQTHAQGLTVTLYTATQRAVKTISKPITIHRSAFGMLDNVDEGLTYTDAMLPEDEYDDTPYEMVDLGLSVKWATCNVGASSPEEYGDYFAWGETEPKEDYSWETYKWCMSSSNTLTKYCYDSSYGHNGFADYKIVLDREDDAATANWGGKWRTPTYDEWKELQDNCTLRYTTLADKDGLGITGYKFTSNRPGYTDKWIFLPAAGVWNGSRFIYVYNYGIPGYYWYSSLYWTSPPTNYYNTSSACCLVFGSEYREWLNTYTSRCAGLSVRPVYGEFVHVTGVSLKESILVNLGGESLQLSATICPENATMKGLVWSCSNSSVATISSDGVVAAVSVGEAEITVRTVDGGYSATCTVSVVFEPSIPEAVDLGLSVKWASFNLGANKTEDTGARFAWGETEPKSDYSWSTYKWCVNGNSSHLTKYCTNSSFGYNGFTDNKIVLDPEDDAAHVLLGENWRMPTHSEWQELIDNCTWNWIWINGVHGIMGTSNKEGYSENCIFFTADTFASFWSSSLYTDNPNYAYYEYAGSGNVSWYNDRAGRYNGLAVRPVCD